MGLQNERPSIGVDHDLAFVSFHLHTGVVAAWVTDRTVEVFYRGQRVAAHHRRHGGPRHGTDPEHTPSAHRRHAEWTPARFEPWAREIGPETELVIAILHERPHPEQSFRTCLGVLRLYRGLTAPRAEAL